jgi:hypothetical protein
VQEIINIKLILIRKNITIIVFVNTLFYWYL